MIKEKMLSYISCVFKGIGFFFIISPILLYWFIHGNYERYIWIIGGPFPFNSFGGGPFQLFTYIILIITGIALTGSGFYIKKKIKKVPIV